jgi:hypothetical protein
MANVFIMWKNECCERSVIGEHGNRWFCPLPPPYVPHKVIGQGAAPPPLLRKYSWVIPVVLMVWTVLGICNA